MRPENATPVQTEKNKMRNILSDISMYIAVGGMLFIAAFLPATAVAECTINGVIYPEEAVVSEYQCQNGEWIELVEGKNTDSTNTSTDSIDLDTDKGIDSDT